MSPGLSEIEHCPRCEVPLPESRICLQCAVPGLLDTTVVTPPDCAETVVGNGPDGESRMVQPGTRLAGYELLEPLSSGAMGLVFRARHVRLRREAALKVMRHAALAGPRERERFRAEAEALARLDHPGVAQCYESGEHEGLPWLAMRLAEGTDLQRCMADWSLPGKTGPRAAALQLAKMFGSLAQALHYAHQRGIVHRDLKPANVVIGPDGAPCLVDFGIARLNGPDDETERATRHGEFMGTPVFAAPEVLNEGARAATALSDIWSVGMMLYECIAGRLPHERDASGVRVLPPGPVVSPRKWNTRIDPDMEAVCLRCVEIDPAQRYASADRLAADFAALMDGRPVSARRLSPARRMLRSAQRRPFSAALIVSAIIAAVALPLWLQARLRVERELNRRQAERVQMQSLQRVLEPLSAGRPLTALRSAFLSLAENNALSPGWERDLPATLLHAGRAWTQHIPKARCLAWSADGSTLAAAGPDGRIVLLRSDGYVSGCQALPWPPGDAGSAVTALAFTADGQLAVACAGQPVICWNASSPAPARVLPWFSEMLAVAPDGGLFAGGAHAMLDAAVLTADGALTRLPESGGLLAAAGGAVFTAGRSNHLCRWELRDGAWHGTARMPLRGQASLLAAGGDMLAWVRESDPQTIRLRNTRLTEGAEESVPGHEGGVTALCFSPDGSMLCSGGGDGVVLLRGMPSLREIRRVPALAPVRAVALSATLAAVLTEDGMVTAWPLAEAAPGEAMQRCFLQPGAPFAAAEARQTGLVVSFPDQPDMALTWPVEPVTGKRSAAGVAARTGEILTFFSPVTDGAAVSLETMEPRAGVLHTVRRVRLQEWPQQMDLMVSGPVHTAVSADGSAVGAFFNLAGGDVPRSIRVWDASTGAQRRLIVPRAGFTVDALSFSADGTRLLVDYTGGEVEWHDLASGKISSLAAEGAAFGKDGSVLCTGAGGGLRVMNADTLAVQSFTADIPPAHVVTQSMDGRLAACAADSGGIVIVHPDSGTVLATLLPGRKFRRLAFLANDATLTAEDAGGQLISFPRRSMASVLPAESLPAASPPPVVTGACPAAPSVMLSPLTAALAARDRELPAQDFGQEGTGFYHAFGALPDKAESAQLSLTVRGKVPQGCALSLCLPEHPDAGRPGLILWSRGLAQLLDPGATDSLASGGTAEVVCDLAALTSREVSGPLLSHVLKTRRLEVRLRPSVAVEHVTLTFPGLIAPQASISTATPPRWPAAPGEPVVSLTTTAADNARPSWIKATPAAAGRATFRQTFNTTAPGHLALQIRVSGELTAVRLDGRVLFSDRIFARAVPVLFTSPAGEAIAPGEHTLEIAFAGSGAPSLLLHGGIWPVSAP